MKTDYTHLKHTGSLLNYPFKQFESILVKHAHTLCQMSDLIIVGVVPLHRAPRLPIVAVSDFKHRHKLHHSKVLGSLSDDAREALRLL